MFNLCNFLLYGFVSLMSLVGIYFTVINRSGSIFEARVLIKVIILFLSFTVFVVFAIQYLIGFIKRK
jgi:hypothetical protein